MIEDALKYFHIFLNIFELPMLLVFLPIALILLIKLKPNYKLIVLLKWLYSAMIPTLMIIVLNHFEMKTYFIFIVIFITLNVLFLYLYYKDIKNNYKKIITSTTSPQTKVIDILESDYGKNKSLEYVALFILPFVTVNDSVNITTIFFILIIVLLIIIRFNLFYLNLPILYFFKIQIIKTNRGLSKIVLTEKDFVFIKGQEYNIREFNRRLNLHIFLSKHNK